MAGVSWPGRSYRLHQSRSTNLLSGLSQRHSYCRGHDAVSSGGGRPPAWLDVVADVAAGVAASGSVDGGDWTAAAAGRDFTGVAAGGELTGIEADGADSGVLARDCGCRWSRGWNLGRSSRSRSGSFSIRGPRVGSTKAARVILPGGEIRQFREAVKAAELMLEHPAYFLVNSRSLNMGRRFSALSADEDLEFGNVYIMFPMKRVNSVITAADMAVLLMAANSAAKRISGSANVKVSPDVAAATAGESPENDVSPSDAFAGLEFRHRLSSCRSKKPVLETIVEEPIRVR
nr:uncharacterized protein LOC109157229 [Ipomoea batatas]